jgi:hypothetical protein
VLQTSVADLRAAEVQRRQVGQVHEVLQTSIGDLGAAEIEFLESG